MIIQPSPTNPRSPLGRALRIAGLALAPVLLVAVVGIGLAGPKPEPSPTPRPTDVVARSAETVTPSPPVPGALTPVPTDTAPGALAIVARPAFPDAFAGLDAVLPVKVLARRASGGANGAVVVLGWLKVEPPAGTCEGGDLGPLGPWCARTGVLAEHAWAVTGADFDPLPAHLHVTVPVGVRLPDPLVRMATADAGPPLPVEVVGRFTGTRCAQADLAWCEEPFVVDRITWADGVRAALTPLADDHLANVRRRANPFASIAVGGRTPLLALLAWPPTIAVIDPATTTAITRLDASEPVWYLRLVGGGGRDDASIGGEPAVRWLLLDERRLEVLATGRTAVAGEAAPVAATSAGPGRVPAVAGGLGVRGLDDVRAAMTTGALGPVAVSGYLSDVRTTGRCVGGGSAGQRLCEWTGRLAPDASPGSSTAGTTVRLPAGVWVPRSLQRTGTEPIPVVLLVRPRLPGPGCSAPSPCEPRLDVDRIAWVDGAEVAQRPVIAPALGSRIRAAAERVRQDAEGFATGRTGTVLVAALVRRSDLGAVDPTASKQLARTIPGGRAVWFIRALETRYGSQTFQPGDVPPRVSWTVVDARTGDMLAWGAG